jgi:nucleotide-binding universal stress UspA family protein
MTILFAYDGSDHAAAAIAKAGELLGAGSAEAVVLAVWEPLTVHALQAGVAGGFAPPIVPLDLPELNEESEQHAKELAERGAGLAGQAGFDAKPAWAAEDRGIADTIVASADELDADLIVLGARGLAGVRAFLGSVSNHVLQHAKRPVLVVPSKKDD